MSDALMAGVSGLKAHQKMLDVAGNNLANVNTTAFKSSRISFVDLLSETVRDASQPTSTVGGTNPQQIGSGVQVSSIDRNVGQGSLVNTGQSLDMAIEGEGFFVVNDGQQDVYTRSGNFAVDSLYYLVDPSTGFRVQRIGAEGVTEGFQSATDGGIRIPYDVALEAEPTQAVTYAGNLSADEVSPTTQTLSSVMAYNTAAGAAASTDTVLSELEQTSGLANGDTITIDFTQSDGTTGTTTFTITDPATQTVGNLISAMDTAMGATTTVTLNNGEIRVKDESSGYSETDVVLTYTGGGTFTLPKYFKITEIGGESSKNTNIEIYDSQGIGHILSVSFARNGNNTWDMVITSMTGDVELVDRRIKDITFLADGSYGGLGGGTPDNPYFSVRYSHDPTNTRTIGAELGTVGEVNGLSQFGGSSTATAGTQDGYASGWLSDVSVTREGIVIGVFENGVRKEVAALKLATFQNAAGLGSIGNSYYQASANSGTAVETRALAGGSGAIWGGALEKSNVDTAEQFVNLIQAQNGYQANARTITVTNDMLKELTNLIR